MRVIWVATGLLILVVAAGCIGQKGPALPLPNLLGGGKPQEYHVQYRAQIHDKGKSSSPDIDSTLDKYVKGGVQRRVDLRQKSVDAYMKEKMEAMGVQPTAQGYWLSTRYFYLPDLKTVVCSAMGNKQETCSKYGARESEEFGDFGRSGFWGEILDYPKSKKPANAPSPMVAGQATECFKETNPYMEGTERYCYTSDGVLLYADTDDKYRKAHVEALRFERSVPDSALIPPPAESREGMPLTTQEIANKVFNK